jgi:hypothetical protein
MRLKAYMQLKIVCRVNVQWSTVKPVKEEFYF